MMKHLILALGLASTTAWAADPPPADCRLIMVASLDLETMLDGRVTAPVKIEGHDYRLMVDTGGYIDTLSPEVVKREGYKTSVSEGTTLRGMGTTLLDTYVKTGDFALGHAHGKGFKFFVEDDNSLFYDGTLAPEIMAGYDTDLDFAHDRMNLIWPDHCPGRVAYWTHGPVAEVPISMEGRTHITVPVTIDGKEVDAILDTGAATSVMTMKTARRYLDLDEKDPALKLLGNRPTNGMMGPVNLYPFKTLSFGAVTVSNPHIEIVSDKVWGENKLLLGIGILRQLHLYIAYKEKKLYLTPAAAN